MTNRLRMAAGLTALVLAAVPLSAQSSPPKPKPTMDHGAAGHEKKADHDKMDHHKMDKEHAASGWKELDKYHKLMMDTWHPAKGSNDLKPLKAKAKDLSAGAHELAKSTPPSACNRTELVEAARVLAPASDALAQQVLAGASDAALKSALHDLHAKFETLEKGCKAGSRE